MVSFDTLPRRERNGECEGGFSHPHVGSAVRRPTIRDKMLQLDWKDQMCVSGPEKHVRADFDCGSG